MAFSLASPPVFAGLAFSGMLCLLSVSAFSSTIYQTGFEPPTITVGQLKGQDNWSASDTGTTTVVETAVVHSGTQAVSVTPGNASSNYGVQHSDPVALSSNSILTLSDYVNFAASNAPTYWTALGSFYTNGYILLNVDQKGQIVLSTSSGDTATGVIITDGTWTQLKLVVDYSAGTITGYDNGVAVGPGVAFNEAAFSNLSTFQFYSQSNAAANPQVGYFDDVSISTSTSASAVPEPASMLSLAAGLAALGAWIRLRRTPITE
jgi:hypothetical protein